ncbi:uncharacterized protein LOC110416385 [Herrania umbratica]|uniref:Uncharacterized protein LOC110416385 n=1 Tax=Herrania umbratica TaxID=108875 RepID=A0A6J1AB72_9ROSI|nr:uncharacterized protein LOC110416385 [Herrania umbratica]
MVVSNDIDRHQRNQAIATASQGTGREYVPLASVVASTVSPPVKRGRPDKGKGIASTSQSRSIESVPQCTSEGGQARIFALGPQDVLASNDVMTEPIFEVPYRMAPAEIRVLREQLQELGEKEFIRPSTFS